MRYAAKLLIFKNSLKNILKKYTNIFKLEDFGLPADTFNIFGGDRDFPTRFSPRAVTVKSSAIRVAIYRPAVGLDSGAAITHAECGPRKVEAQPHVEKYSLANCSHYTTIHTQFFLRFWRTVRQAYESKTLVGLKMLEFF